MSESNEKKDGSCCKPNSCSCGCKKFILGVLFGILIAIVACNFMSGGSMCGKAKICPISMQQVPAQQ